MLPGQVIEGFCVSLTVTVNEQVPVLLLASVAVQVTDVVPFEKAEPLAGKLVVLEVMANVRQAIASSGGMPKTFVQ